MGLDENDDPLRMYIVVRRGAFDTLTAAGEAVGAAAVRCVREHADDPALLEWRPRPGKVVLRARGGQWHELTGSYDGDVVALPPRRRSERGPLLERMQAMTSELEPPPSEEPDSDGFAYLLNPSIEMSSGKTLAQIAHAAVMAADSGDYEDWVADGCPAAVVRPTAASFGEQCRSPELAAKVEDAGLTEVPPGTVTVLMTRSRDSRA